jgi:hypothetical protein
MADDGAVFTTVAGMIQFPVESRDLDSGQTVRDATIRSLASGEPVRITFWPDFAEAEFEQGDFIVVDGKVTTRKVGDRVFVNMSARKLAVLKPVEPAEREVIKKNTF